MTTELAESFSISIIMLSLLYTTSDDSKSYLWNTLNWRRNVRFVSVSSRLVTKEECIDEIDESEKYDLIADLTVEGFGKGWKKTARKPHKLNRIYLNHHRPIFHSIYT